ncbi:MULTISPECIES: Hsp20/alpha crystallin family protein [Pontibacter]|uniref:Heat shock protein Hsp20 n=1 Tax=Pontibacter lucknowensis TaxID=1077936 RepID=A0A1N6TRQ7_9BACT|nr:MULTISPECIES: Hsp20/alpha crystallin family protein [Pontibacter]EJF08523.1 heat shock protein hsp20 [Pontibacter sp. BAB1700]SIQ56058.1 heat shock protein Hsp20 [Pontibacter lucknowensis]
MVLRKYNGMQDDMPQTFSSMLDRFFNESVNSRGFAGFTPHVDACETENGYEIEVALPGIRKEDISIDFQEGKLTISGERRFEKKEEGRRYQMLETQYGTFSRSFYLPDNVNADKISAQLQDGVLVVNVPKDEQKTMKRQITISGGEEAKQPAKQKRVAASATENGREK